MSLTEKEVLHVARLARLALSAEEVRLYEQQLGHILDHIQELNQLDTSSVVSTAHGLGLVNVLREDEVRCFDNVQAILTSAPESEGPYFKVPKVIE